ncbi:MAG: hypothetical protein AAB965_03965 [Patescibacteria group bacterium]
MLEAIWSPELEAVFQNTKSQIIYEEDESSVQVRLVCEGVTWMKYRLRDRTLDGPGWKPTVLVDWDYSREVDRFTLGRCVEESVYCLDPRFPLTRVFSKKEADFIRNPFALMPFDEPTEENLRGWLRKWKKAYIIGDTPFPGYFSLRNIPGARGKIATGVSEFLKSKGYEYLSAVPTWWHIANMLRYHFGFKYVNGEDESKMELLRMRLPILGNDESARRRLSWVVMLQFWVSLVEASGFSPEGLGLNPSFILRDDDDKILTFPLSPERNLWMVKKI